jgi:hypothetical protein
MGTGSRRNELRKATRTARNILGAMCTARYHREVREVWKRAQGATHTARYRREDREVGTKAVGVSHAFLELF